MLDFTILDPTCVAAPPVQLVMDCHVMVRGSIPGRNGVKTKLHVFCKLVNGGAVSI